MYECDPRCFDYTNGHICKHIHRVHSLSHEKATKNPQVDVTNIEDADVHFPDTDENNGTFSVYIFRNLIGILEK